MGKKDHALNKIFTLSLVFSTVLFLILTDFYCSVGESTNNSLTASFTFSPSSPVAGQAVQFTDTSTGSPTSWQWNLGDGANSTAQNPTHTYSTVSSYNVALRISNDSGSNSTSRTITVLPTSSLAASFTYSPASPAAGQPVQFTDTSTGIPTSWGWDFGDGTTSAAQNPVHTFATASSYSVSLTVEAGSNSNSASKTVIVRQPGTIIATSPSYADVSAAISSASPGDTVIVPAGTATWGSQLTIRKGIYLIGAGVGITVITSGYSGSYLILYNPSDYVSNAPFRLSGFTFNLNGKSGWLALGEADKSAPFVVQDKVRIDHNRILNPRSMSAQFIWNYCDMYGVVDNNTMEGGDYFFKNDTQGTECGWWNTSPQNTFVSGSSNYLYFEDNVFAMTGTDNLLCEAQYSGRYAFRYNKITGAKSYSLFEVHPHWSGGHMGACFGAEVYGNQIDCGSFPNSIFKTRGGKSFVFYNNITSSESCDLVAYDSNTDCAPCHPELQIIHDNYWFQNRHNLTGVFLSRDVSGSYTCVGQMNNPTAGRDVMTNTTTPGITAGPLANLPATCVLHQGYWATDQSTTDLTGMVGVNPATPISGTLYICTSTNVWTPFYTPYAYPHPLRTLLSGQAQYDR